MSTPGNELDEHLRELFRDLDTQADFDERLMARVRAASLEDWHERAARARQRERAEYRRAVLELQGRRRLLSLEVLGIALLLMVAGLSVWPRFSQDVLDLFRQYGPFITMILAVVIAAVPLLGVWVEETRDILKPD